MEIEFKYAVPSRELADNIWEDPYIGSLSDASTAESVVMKAIYFDTDDGDLVKNNIALRVRSEGEMSFATLKWGGKKTKDGLHQREEINIPVSDQSSFFNLDPSIFKETPVGDKLMELVSGKILNNLLEMRFLRRRKRVTYKNTVLEIALDNGSIICDNGEVPIMELEIELFAGSEEELAQFGAELTSKFGITPKDSSKFKDGLRLLKQS